MLTWIKRQRPFLQRNHTEDFVDGIIRGKSTIENGELSLESLWYVVSSTARLYHGSYKLYVNNGCEISWFLQIVHATHFHHLSCYFIGNLVIKFDIEMD